jgi:hypothetical protein
LSPELNREQAVGAHKLFADLPSELTAVPKSLF